MLYSKARYVTKAEVCREVAAAAQQPQPSEGRVFSSVFVHFSVIGGDNFLLGKFQRLTIPQYNRRRSTMVQFANPATSMKDDDSDILNPPLGSSSDEERTPNGTLKRKSESDGQSSKKKKKRSKSQRELKVNGTLHSKRRHSVSKPARDPRDEASPLRPQELAGTRSPSPVIDFDGLSRPSKFPF